MPSNELKQRKKNASQKQHDESRDGAKDNGGLDKKADESTSSPLTKSCSCLTELRTILCLLCVSACVALTWLVMEQNGRLADVEKKYRLLHSTTAAYSTLEQRIETVSDKCETLRSSLSQLESQVPVSNMSALEQEVLRMTAWSSEANERRRVAQEKLTSLGRAVHAIEERTSTITRDMGAKVAAVRTDVRRMGGLETDVMSLLERATELESKADAVERAMVKRMAELLASSIDRVSTLKTAAASNMQRLDATRQPIAQLQATDTRLAERIATLESSRARLMRTVAFAGDLKPKVFTIQRDLGAVEPRLDDLTLRIGHLAGDVMHNDRDLAELRDKLDTLRGSLDTLGEHTGSSGIGNRTEVGDNTDTASGDITQGDIAEVKDRKDTFTGDDAQVDKLDAANQ